MARSSFSTTAFAQLVNRLRHTNTRYDQIVRQFRSRLRPTYHAKRRAYWAGLRIDVSKARACPGTLVSRRPLPIIDTASHSSFAAAPLAFTSNHNYMSTLEGNTLGLQLTNLPERQRLTIRVPPLSYEYGYGYATPVEVNAPGAPLLRPRQLPEDDSEMEDISLAQSSSSSSASVSADSLLTPIDFFYTGLRITIPARSLKRKLQDDDADENESDASPSRQPKVGICDMDDRRTDVFVTASLEGSLGQVSKA
ncbi:hypothetical protein BS17DRAFT_819885 [Gyrodon lividus]|nr:hypothetical protein BS17DRAFT_819885 [Gyrodon lividus]